MIRFKTDGEVGVMRNPESPSEAAARKLAWQMEPGRSVEIEVETKHDLKFAKPIPGAGGFDATEEHSIESAGKRFCDSRSYHEGKLTSRTSYYWDGSKGGNLTFRAGDDDRFETQQTFTITPHYYTEIKGERMERPQPLLFLYVGREPLHKALGKAAYLGDSTVLNRDCDRFLFRNVQWMTPQDHVYHLDRETAIPLKVEAFRDEEAQLKNEPLWIWEALSLDQVEDLRLPLHSEDRILAGNSAGSRREIAVKSIRFRQEYPASTFWPKVEPGATVFDTIKNKARMGIAKSPPEEAAPGRNPAAATTAPSSPADASARAAASNAGPADETPVVEQAIQAVPPTTDWSQTASRISLVFGVAVIAVGLILIWRRR